MSLKENSYPVDERGKPDLSYYRDGPEYYAAMHEEYRRAVRTPGHESKLEFGRRVHSAWGLIAQGAASVPYAIAMLESGDSATREDGAGVLAQIGRDPAVVTALLDQLAVESDTVARDGIILALGALKSLAAIPALGAIIRDPKADGDTRWTAAESLGRIVRRRFERQPDAIEAAIAWLDKHGAR